MFIFILNKCQNNQAAKVEDHQIDFPYYNLNGILTLPISEKKIYMELPLNLAYYFTRARW